ncbi:ABC transporter ATP-binding protein [Thorsellia kenyensis]|uniref:ABC transporter ATP-binding protein n=1 Tax=Thorsellia kenyensis TaxID=1549888 RepID=A0ABV6C844_9GAMM
MAKLVVDKLTKTFGDFYAAKEISFTANEGEFVTLLGPSGCGKTTLLKMIGGFHQPDSGRIKIGEKEVTHLTPEKRNTAMCFQSYALFPHLNVSHNICFGLKQRKIALSEQKKRLEKVIQQVGLKGQELKMPSQLSGGQQQRVALARAMITQPDVILFDEPLSNLDAKLRESVRYEIKELQKQYNLTSIYVTHDQSEALAMSDKIIVLNAGSIEQMGKPEDIYFRPTSRFVADFIGAANIVKAKVKKANSANYYHVACELGNFYVYSDISPRAEEVYVCWRPENLHYIEDGPVANISGMPENFCYIDIEKLAFMGSTTEGFGRCGEGLSSFRVQFQLKPNLSQSNKACFRLTENAIHFLEPVRQGS